MVLDMEQADSGIQNGKAGPESVLNNIKLKLHSPKSETTRLEVLNGVHENGSKDKLGTPTARVYTRKRGRDTTPEMVMKKVKLALSEEKIGGVIGRTAEILLVLAGLRQMSGGKPVSPEEMQLAADAHRNLEILVARAAPSSLLSKRSLENMLEALNFRLTADNRIEAAPQAPEVEQLRPKDQEPDSDVEGSENDANTNPLAENPGLLLSPNLLALDDDPETDSKQTDDYEEYPDAHMRHKQLVKVVQQLKAESYVPQTGGAISNAYMNTVAPCVTCQAIVKDSAGVLVCDGCEKIYHQKCITTFYLKFHPKGDWYCPKCVSDGGGKPQNPKYGQVRKNVGSGSKLNTPVLQGVANGPSVDQQKSESETKTQDVEGKKVEEDQLAAKSELAMPQLADDTSTQATSGSPQTENSVAAAASQTGVEWLGEPRVSKDRSFYNAFNLRGCTFKVKDCALFHPDPPDSPPYIARLQAMWEEHETNRKYVRVNWCYYPNDNQLPPDVPGRPETYEVDEVYESNHCDDNIIESIQGPCQVLSPQKYMEEKQKRAKLVSGGFSGNLPPIFLSKWNFDARAAVFRKASED